LFILLVFFAAFLAGGMWVLRRISI
jgi:hypothetical protein